MLYMFQAVPPPIIRSSKLYTQHRVFVKLFLLLTAIVSWNVLELTHDSGRKQKNLDKYPMLCIQSRAPDDGQRNRLKHSEYLQ